MGDDVGSDDLDDHENRESRELMPDDPHLLFNRIITTINGSVVR